MNHRVMIVIALVMTFVVTPARAIDALFPCNKDTDVARGNGWAFIADGPVHFQPIAAGGSAYFTSDDGCLYCVDPSNGEFKWKVRGGPSDRKMIDADSRRLISAWPARGGPVVHDGVVYFGAGLFTPTGIYVVAVDATTGRVKWRKEIGSLVNLFGAVKVGHVPLGSLSVSNDTLVVPTTSSYLELSRLDGSVVRSGPYFRAHGRESYIKKHNNHWHWSELWSDPAARVATEETPLHRGASAAAAEAERILQSLDHTGGYCIVAGLNDGMMAEEIAVRSGMHVIAVDQDQDKVTRLRRRWIDLGIYGRRIVALTGDPTSCPFPPKFARLVISETLANLLQNTSLVRSVNPQRGVVFLKSGKASWSRADASVRRTLPQVESPPSTGIAIEEETGWTHGGANAGNTWMSFDQELKPPLSALWFGGRLSAQKTSGSVRSHITLETYPMLISGGMIYQRVWCDGGNARYGMGSRWWKAFRTYAYDLYTGELIWDVESAGLEEMVATPQGLYQGVDQTSVVLLDSRTGAISQRLSANGENFKIVGDYLVSTTGKPHDRRGEASMRRGAASEPVSTDRGTVRCLHRHTGQLQWEQVNCGSLFAIGNTRVYVLGGDTLTVLDVESGRTIDRFPGVQNGNFIQYQRDADVVVISTRKWDFSVCKDGVSSRGSSFTVYDGSSGKELWKNSSRVFFLNLTRDYLFNMFSDHAGGNGERFDIRTGANRVSWRSGKQCVRQFCGNEHVMLYRAWNAVYYEIEENAQRSLGSFRSGCVNKMCVGEGVLVRPDDSHDCDCTWPLNTPVGYISAE